MILPDLRIFSIGVYYRGISRIKLLAKWTREISWLEPGSDGRSDGRTAYAPVVKWHYPEMAHHFHRQIIFRRITRHPEFESPN